MRRLALGAVRWARAAGERAWGVQASGRAGAGGRAGGRGERSAGGQAAARAAGAGVGARGAGCERAERGAWARGLGMPVRAGCTCWLVSWASFGAQCTWLSFDSVFGPVRLGIFLSHLMNTVHCKINFRKKKYLLNLIKIKLKSNKI